MEQSALSYGSPPPDLQFGPDLSTVTIETVLAWDVFQGRFDAQLDIKSVLKNYEMPPSPMTSPVGEAIPLINSLELGSCNRLLDSFLSRVHIANPILDVELIRSYVNSACMHGVGWDAQSCLVVSLLSLQVSVNHDKLIISAAPCLRPRLYCRSIPRPPPTHIPHDEKQP